MIALATAFAVIFVKEVFGGTGYNIFNVALVARAFLFFAYPSMMSGDRVFVRTGGSFGMGRPEMVNGIAQTVDGFSGATPLGQLAITDAPHFASFGFTGVTGQPLTLSDMFWGFIPGSVGEVSTFAILLGAILLISTGVGSWKTMLSVFLGGLFTISIVNLFAVNPIMEMSAPSFSAGWICFWCRIHGHRSGHFGKNGKRKVDTWLLIGLLAITIRVFNRISEGMMLAILLTNAFAPLIDSMWLMPTSNAV